MQANTRALFRFLLTFLGIYLGLILLVHLTGGEKAYRNVFHKAAAGLYSEFRGEVLVFFQPSPSSSGDYDTIVQFQDKKQRENAIADARARGLTSVDVQQAQWQMDTWYFAFLPTLFLAALFLATPLPWKDRIIALTGGLLIFHLYLLLRLYLVFTYVAGTEDWLSSIQISGWWKSFLFYVHNNIFIEFNYVIITLLWVLLAFRMKPFVRDVK